MSALRKTIRQRKNDLLALAAFSALTLILTYPLILNLGTGVRDKGDPALNSYIMAWEAHQFDRLDFSHFFDTNMFYPFKGTLTYSEILLPQAVAAFPILAVFGNPILSYNIVLLLAFLTSALGMRALARHLVKNEFAAFLAGLIYAFSPFMFSHLSHLQVITAGGLPLAMLYLHKFFEDGRTRDILGFTFFYIIQFLANGYYGIFLTLFAGLFIVAWMIVERRYADRKFWARLALFAALAAAFVGPVLSRYFLMSRGTDFNRGPGSPLPLTSYMTAPSINRLYGQITQPFRKSEGDLFPGIIAVILAGLGLAANLRIRPMSSRDEFSGRPKMTGFARAAVTGLMAADAFWILAEIMSGFELGSSNEVLFHPACLLRLPIPAGILIFLIALRRTFERRLRGPAYRISFKDKKFWTYPVLLILAALLTLGSRGLYVILYKCVPGFSGLRATPRFHIFFMLALAVLAAHGAKALMESARPKRRAAVFILIPLLILAEFASIPIPLAKLPAPRDIPEVYRWLAAEKGNNRVLLELPLPASGAWAGAVEASRLYFSTFHWTRMVNGYSGYIPPLYSELCFRWTKLPLAEFVKDAADLGVNTIIFHATEPFTEETLRLRIAEARSEDEQIVLEKAFGTDYVFAVKASRPAKPLQAESRVRRPLEKKGWTVTASAKQDQAAKAVDGSMATRWESGPQAVGVSVAVDLKTIETVGGFSFKLGRSPLDYPRGYLAEVSTDGKTWETVARQEKTVLPIRAFLRPKDLGLEVEFAPRGVRYIRITNTAEEPIYYWSIYEIEVYH
jgi:hypothetical protein